MDQILKEQVLAPPVVSVSIICANYNNGPYLSDLIDSIHHSTVHPTELIIVDDGSTDDSLSVLDTYAHLPYLRVVALPRNIGFANALNEAMNHATQDYFMRIDPDDYLDHKRIERQYDFLQKNPQVAVVGSNVTYFESEYGKLINHSNFPIGMRNIFRRYKNGEHGILHGTVMVRQEVFRQYQYRQEIVPAEDYEIFAKMIRDGHQFENLPESLTYVRVHTTSVSNDIRFNTIKTKFQLRDEIFGTRTSRFQILAYFIHIYYYRKYLFESGSLLRYGYLAVSIFFRPIKLIKRFTGWR